MIADTKQSCAIFSAVSCQNTITHNIMFHGPRALVNMNDGNPHVPKTSNLSPLLDPIMTSLFAGVGFGGDTLIESNLFFASLLETSDQQLPKQATFAFDVRALTDCL